MTFIPKHRTKAVVAALIATLLAVGPATALPFPTLPATPASVSGGAPFQALATVYAEDFELGDGGYTTGGAASWQYGSASSPPETAVGQGPSMWGTNLAGDYGNSECGYVQSSPMDLSAGPAGASTGVSTARLAFRHWMHVEKNYDAGLVLGSADGENWDVLTPTGGYTSVPLTAARACFGIPADGRAFTTESAAPAVDAWKLAEFDVSAYLGGALHVRWVFASDSSVVKRGWYVDDVLVQLGVGASATVPLPTVDSAVGVPFTAISTVYAEDFEATDGGWTVDGTNAWEWGAPSAPPITGVGSLNLWGTGLLGDYSSDACSALTSPAISLPGASATAAQTARLSFKLWRHLEYSYDAVVLQGSTDGGATWQRLVPEGGYDRALTSSLAATTRACLGVTTSHTVWNGPSAAPRDDEFMDVSVDVSNMMGSDAMFRFVFGSNSAGVRRGAYLDDVIVQVGVGATANAAGGGSPSIPNPLWTIEGSNPSWEYGIGSSPQSFTPVWATNLDGLYNNNECSSIISSPIDTSAIPGLGRLELSFQHALETASSADGAAIQVSNDGGASWKALTPIGGYSGTVTGDARDCIYGGSLISPGWHTNVAFDWTDVRASLQSYQGQTVQIRFVFGTSASGQDPGWAIRNIALTRGAGNVPLGLAVGVDDALGAKMDPALADLLVSGAPGPYRVLVMGQPHEGVADLGFATRAEYTAWFAEKSAPMLEALQAIARAHGADVDGVYTVLPGIAATLDLGALVTIAARDDVRSITLDSDESLKLIEPIADDGLDASNTQGRQMLQAEDIWALGYKGAGISVTVIDTGIDATHEAFKNADGSSRVAAFADCMSATCNVVAPWDDHGHGTHVAGTSVGSSTYTDPTWGVFQETGVAPEATLTVAKFLNSGGSGSFAGGVASLQWAYNVAQADITSNSWGGSGCSSSGWPTMQAVRTLTDAGMLSVFAAGNSGPSSGSIGNPGCSESALTVGAVDSNRNIASFSSRGPCTDSEIGGSSRVCPDVVAKGVAVRSAIPRSGAGHADPSGYKVWQGTSMATPHIAGAVALAEQMKRALTGNGWDTAARAEEQVFKMTAEDLGVAGEDSTYGWGLPQLLTIYALLDATDEARIVATFGISNPVIRQGDSTLLSFSVRNLGGALADGDFLATLEDPNGGMTTIKSSTVSLGLLDGESASSTFAVSGTALPGTYTFRGSFAYSWTNGTTNELVTDVVEREGTFDVKRVFVSTEMDGLDARTTSGDLQSVTYTATNTGNEDARSLTIEFTVPDAYVFVPGANFDPSDPNSRYANPAPSRVVEDKNFGRVTLVFEVGDLPQDSSFSFETQLLPTTPGTYRVLSVAKWQDGAGKPFSQGSLTTQVVGLPSA